MAAAVPYVKMRESEADHSRKLSLLLSSPPVATPKPLGNFSESELAVADQSSERRPNVMPNAINKEGRGEMGRSASEV